MIAPIATRVPAETFTIPITTVITAIIDLEITQIPEKIYSSSLKISPIMCKSFIKYTINPSSRHQYLVGWAFLFSSIGHNFFFWPCHVACDILVPWPGIKPTSPALEAQCLNHWITREVLWSWTLKELFLISIHPFEPMFWNENTNTFCPNSVHKSEVHKQQIWTSWMLWWKHLAKDSDF